MSAGEARQTATSEAKVIAPNPFAKVETSVHKDNCPLDKDNMNYPVGLSVPSEQILLADNSRPG